MLLSPLFLVAVAAAEQRFKEIYPILIMHPAPLMKHHPQIYSGAGRLVHKQGWEQLKLALLGG